MELEVVILANLGKLKEQSYLLLELYGRLAQNIENNIYISFEDTQKRYALLFFISDTIF